MGLSRRSLSFRLFLLASVLSLLFLLHAAYDYDPDFSLLPDFLKQHSSCPPAAYNTGQWVYHPRTNSSEMTSPRDALTFSGFRGCASSREFDWHLAADKPEQWDRFPAAHNWKWTPSQECTKLQKFEPERVVQHLVERGGWLLVGGQSLIFLIPSLTNIFADSVTENHFFSISCMLYPHVLGSPNYTENPYFDRAWPQHLHLNPHSPLVHRLKFPRGFNISTTPLVSFRRVDLLFSQQELVDIYHSANPDAPSDFKLFSHEAVWTLSPSEYMDIFTAPLPQANYRTMIVSTAGHWTTTMFSGFRDESKSSEGYGIDGVLKLFETAMPRWAQEVQSILNRKAGNTKRRVVARAYLPGHEDCHDHREPWTEIKPFVWNWFNWGNIWEFNQIFEVRSGSHMFMCTYSFV